MLELVASLVVDLSDRRLSFYTSQKEVVRVIPVSTGEASTPTPIFNSKAYTKCRSMAEECRASLRRPLQPWLCAHADERCTLVV